ncbi:ORF2 [callitrichine gammaherpesvirus 3]|uniref:ORF2 n=1 Tax=callitrichine gammaherpesvirus 3 TaxID=106331 RepID=Q993K9_9GAMA|nr:ORF2 [callitrichine gammaherpesvirus 3]AAK38209.1 ORF2 [callitrichine gammaherpesvirus 3]
MQASPAPEDNLGSHCKVGPCGYLYFYPLDGFPIREASLLGTGYHGHKALTLPLLCGLTVENGFSFNVKALHRRPDPNTGLLRATCFHRDAYVFHNATAIPPVFSGPGLELLCDETREVYGYDAYSPPVDARETKVEEYFPSELDPSAYVGAAIVTEAFKERLYSGNLVVILSLKREVSIGGYASICIPLYDREVFPGGVAKSAVFFNKALSKCMYETLYTGLAQSLRLRRVDEFISAMERQSLHDQIKVPKVAHLKEFNAATLSHPESSAVMIVDTASCELATSYGPAMIDAVQEPPTGIRYDAWPVFEGCENEDARLKALHGFNALLAPHAAAQIFSTNSVLYVSGVSKSTQGGRDNTYNSFFITHGLGSLQEGTWDQNRQPVFSGWAGPDVTGSSGPGNYSVEHLVFAASFSPNLLARYAYYLQFCQGQKSSLNQSHEIGSYVAGAATSSVCSLCEGSTPAVCLNTLFFRLRDRFPPVTSTHRRDPYVITGASGAYNETDFLGNFLNFVDRDDDGQRVEDEPRYTYWQLNQNLIERLSRLGIDGDGNCERDPKTARDFMKLLKDVDQAVDAEVVQFMGSMAKNNVGYKDLIKSCYHILQYSCNPYAQAPCTVFLQLFYRSMFTILQDIALPICMCYENDNPGLGQSAQEWLKGHYQTLCTNFRSLAVDKGTLTAKEVKVVHPEPTSDVADLDAAIKGRVMVQRLTVRMSKVLMLCPKNIKIKNRIVFTGENSLLQNNFIKSTAHRDNYIINGPYIKLLNNYHKVLFPETKLSCLYLWHNFARKRTLPIPPGGDNAEYSDLALFVDSGSRAHEQANVIDIVPGDLITYAKQRMNNSILKACGQTQFFISLLHALVPKIQTVPARDYPHVLGGDVKLTSSEDYTRQISNMTAKTFVCTVTDVFSEVSRARPIITLPLTVNKYTGVNGNSQIFQAGNLGYFMGRGVDRNLLPGQSLGLKKQMGGVSMRKKFVFATPTLGLTSKRRPQMSVSFEIEKIRSTLEAIISQKQEEDSVVDVVCKLVECLGEACASLTLADAEYLLGRYSILASCVLESLEKLAAAGVEWNTEVARDFLDSLASEHLAAGETFISIEEPVLIPASGGLSIGSHGTSTVRRKRRLGTALQTLDV